MSKGNQRSVLPRFPVVNCTRKADYTKASILAGAAVHQEFECRVVFSSI